MAGKQREKPLVRLIRAVLTWWRPCYVLLLLVGFGGFLALPMFERWIKFDEKSLMVGGAHATLRSSAGAVDAGKAIAEHVHAAQHAPRSAGHHTQLLSLLKAHMESMSLEAYTSFGGLLPQQPTPAGSGHGANAAANSSRSCTNLHGILRSPLGDGKESIVLVTPMALTIGPGGDGFGDAHPAGAPLLAAAATAFLNHMAGPGAIWQAKDLVWVVPDARCGSLPALETWAAAYQGQQAPQAPLFGRAGVMQQALVLEADRVNASSLEVLLEGAEGQLPKLDTYQLLRTCAFALRGVRVALRDAEWQPKWAVAPLLSMAPGASGYASKIATLLQFVSRQALGSPTGAHAALKPYLVDAATARLGGKVLIGKAPPPPPLPSEGVEPPQPLHPELRERAMHLAEYIELVVRSLNNLDERFHHSYFLYLLTSEDTFVTVEVYIVPLVALIAAIMLKAAAIRAALAQAAGDQQAHASSQASAPTDAAASSGAAVDAAAGEEAERSVWPTAIGAALLAMLLSWLTGWAVRGSMCPASSSQDSRGIWGRWPKLTSGTSMDATVLALAAVVTAASAGRYAWACTRAVLSGTTAKAAAQGAAIRVALLSMVCMVLTAMASINWAVAYAVAAVLVVPVGVGATGTAGAGQASRRRRLVHACVLAATSPATVAALLGAGALVGLGYEVGSERNMLGLVWTAARALACSSWPTTFSMFWIVYIPAWATEALLG